MLHKRTDESDNKVQEWLDLHPAIFVLAPIPRPKEQIGTPVSVAEKPETKKSKKSKNTDEEK